MKRLLIFLSLCCGIALQAQQTEFPAYANGLIYSEAAIGKLKYIVDSLNLKFKVCEPNKSLYAIKQGKGHHFYLSGKQAKKAKKDILDGISFSALAAKYPKAGANSNLRILQRQFFDYNEDKFLRLSSFTLQNAEDQIVDHKMKKNQKPEVLKAGQWFYEFSDSSDFTEPFISAFFITEVPVTHKLPMAYSRMILYSECLIDTTSQIFYDRPEQDYRKFKTTSSAEKFVSDLDSITNRPKLDYELMMKLEADTTDAGQRELEKIYADFRNRDSVWQLRYFSKLDSLKQKQPWFTRRLQEAYGQAKEDPFYNEDFEAIVGHYYSKDAELELKRRRRVVGRCSMDSRPRNHARNIALLAAETTKWEIFLKCHLNIMNDRFDRVSDGSWAEKTRQTYIKELEVLDINVPDLILGTVLRVEDVAENHYFSSIDRIGRALSESAHKNLMEVRLLNMIADAQLDDYNRVLMYYLFDYYNFNLTDKNRQKANLEKLRVAIASLSTDLSRDMVVKEYSER